MCLALDELAECIPDGTEAEGTADALAIRTALNGFLATLPKKKRILFVRRYWYLYTTKELALALRMTETNVKVSLLRMRDKLKEYLEREGIKL